MKQTVQEISLKDVCLDRETQIRATVSEETIQRYYEVMADREGRDKFPPVLLFRDDEGNYWLADGHHRVMAAIRRKFPSIMAIVRPGTKADAIWEAAKSNGRNGLPLGRSDIRRAVEMLANAYPDRSNRVIAEVLGCDEKTVRKYRPVISTADKSAVETRVGKDGKRRSTKPKKTQKVDTAKCQTRPKEESKKNMNPQTKPAKAPTLPPVATKTVQADKVPQAPNRTANTTTDKASKPDARLIAASVKRTQIHDTISRLQIQIEEWFEFALEDQYEDFDNDVGEKIRTLIR